MKKILNIVSSPRGAASNSIQLADALIGKLKAANPGSTVTEKNLGNAGFPHLEEAHIAAFYTPQEQRSPANIEAIRHSDEAIQQLFDADIIVIGAPMYNFSIPSSLKAWIDHISRAGVTFSYGANGPEGLVKGKKIYLVISTGGIYTEGVMKGYDFIEPYLKSLLSFLGMSDITVVRVEGVSIPGVQDTAMEKAISSISL